MFINCPPLEKTGPQYAVMNYLTAHPAGAAQLEFLAADEGA